MARVLVGAVAYTANVVPIWEGIRDYFRGSAVEMDFVLFSNYEQLVDALMAGWIDIAWNTNLAYARTYGLTDGTCVALAMRDTDATFRSVLVKRTGSELESMADLVGQRIALGSKDSGQARILPVKFLADAGITSENSTFVIFDSDVGKHGDTGRSRYHTGALITCTSRVNGATTNRKCSTIPRKAVRKPGSAPPRRWCCANCCCRKPIAKPSPRSTTTRPS